MLYKQLRDQWHARGRAVPIHPDMTFTPEGLVLGAGTVLIAAHGRRRLHSLQGREAQVLALLSAAYGKAVAPAVLGNIERAAKSWGDGEDASPTSTSHIVVCRHRATFAPQRIGSLWPSTR